MKKGIKCIVFLLTVLFISPISQATEVPVNGIVSVYFSPNGGCTQAIVTEINKAKGQILVQAYSFTSSRIAKALIDAHKRGVKVEILLDKSQKNAKYSSSDFTAHAGIATLIDSAHPIAHNKIIIIDSETVITGSFNFSKAAEKNSENILILRGKSIASVYKDNYIIHRKHSEVYRGNEKWLLKSFR